VYIKLKNNFEVGQNKFSKVDDSYEVVGKHQ